ncbi:MAG: hypothetical protein R3B13_32585 [Polyangiaceae bacterium]
MKRHFLAWALLSSLLTGCLAPPQTGGEPENTAPPQNALDDPSHPGIEACAGGDVEAELEIARDFESSCHEMVICGGLTSAFAVTLIEVLFNSASGSKTDADGFTYEGSGKYSAGTRMQLQLRLNADTSFGAKGDVIDFDVFNLANYFGQVSLKASASVDTSGNTHSSVSVEYADAGPGAELLGLHEASGSLSLSLDEILASLGQNVTIEQRIFMLDDRETSLVKYELYSPELPLKDYFEKGPMDMQLVSVSGSSPRGQSLQVQNWGMEYRSTSQAGTLDGSIDLLVAGGAFDYGVRYQYPHRKTPDVTLSCL